jgi:hypothetical protein
MWNEMSKHYKEPNNWCSLFHLSPVEFLSNFGFLFQTACTEYWAKKNTGCHSNHFIVHKWIAYITWSRHWIETMRNSVYIYQNSTINLFVPFHCAEEVLFSENVVWDCIIMVPKLTWQHHNDRNNGQNLNDSREVQETNTNYTIRSHDSPFRTCWGWNFFVREKIPEISVFKRFGFLF